MRPRGEGSRVSRFAAAEPEALYMPPHRVAALEKRALSREERQRVAWERLRKRVHGVVNRVNARNASECVVELLRLNVVRGLGLLCRSLMRVQVLSQGFSPVYAALVAALNARVPELGEVLLARVVAQLKRGMDQKDRGVCVASVKFIAHLFNQSVVDALLPLEIMNLLAESPSNDSVELLVAFMKECGALLEDNEPRMLDDLFQLLRRVVQEGDVDTRIQYLVEGLMSIRRSGFKDFVTIPKGLDLIPDEERIIHSTSFTADEDIHGDLDMFSFDENWEEAEVRYALFRLEVLGESDDLLFEDTESEPESAALHSGTVTNDGRVALVPVATALTQDMTEEDLVVFRRKVYLHIMSAVGYEECAHKLAIFMRGNTGQEGELCNMIIECCSQERTFMTYYGLVAKQFCLLRRVYVSKFEEAFAEHYATIHRFDSRKIRNMANFYAFLLSSDALPWSIFGIVVLSKEETTASSRIFLKYLLVEMSQILSVDAVSRRLEGEELSPYVSGILPSENAGHVQFAIEFFDAIGLQLLTVRMKATLRTLPSTVAALGGDAAGENGAGDDGSSSSSVLSSSSGPSSSLSESSFEDERPRRQSRYREERSPADDSGSEYGYRRRSRSPLASDARGPSKYPRHDIEHEHPRGYRRDRNGIPDRGRYSRSQREQDFQRRDGPRGPQRAHEGRGMARGVMGRGRGLPPRDEFGQGRGRGAPRGAPSRDDFGRGRGRGRGQNLTVPAWVTKMREKESASGVIRGDGGSKKDGGKTSSREESLRKLKEAAKMGRKADRFRDPSRSPSPLRSRDADRRRVSSPSPRELSPDRRRMRDRSPDPFDRDAPRKEVRREAEDGYRKRISPDGRDHSLDRRDRSPDRRDHSLDRRDCSPNRRDHSLDRRDRSLDRRDHSLDRRDRSPGRRDHSLDRRGRSPDRRYRSPDSRDRSPDRRGRSPDRQLGRDRSPEAYGRDIPRGKESLRELKEAVRRERKSARMRDASRSP